MEPMRIQKYLADQGVCSRRRAEELIASGKVKLNGKIVTEMGIKIDPSHDVVAVYDKEVENKKENFVYIALNKPTGYITSVTDNQGKSVTNLLSRANCQGILPRDWKLPRVFPVGRLDKDSEGLMLLTNDGELTNLITHPRYEHEKEYVITIAPQFNPNDKKELEGTMIIDDEEMSGLKIKNITHAPNQSTLILTLTEGKNRQIRRMFSALKYKTLKLTRTRINKLQLKNIPLGKWKLVKKENII